MNDTAQAEAVAPETESKPMIELPAEEAKPEAELEVSEQAEESTTSETEETGHSDDSTAEPEKPNKVQKRIDELTAKFREAEREAEYYRSLVEDRNKPPEISEPVKPNLEDFDYDTAQFAEAMETYADQRAQWVNYQNQEKLKSEQQQIESQKRVWRYQDRANNFARENPDFFQVTTSDQVTITQEMSDIIVDSETGPKLAYYLGKNPNLAMEIARLPSHLQYKEMGRLEYEINSKAPPAPQTTQAPAPIKPVGTNSNVSKEPSEMSYDEFVTWRQKQIAARR